MATRRGTSRKRSTSKLGGKSGIVTIEGEQYCLKDAGCGSVNAKANDSDSFLAERAISLAAPGGDTAKPPEDRSTCNQENNFCLEMSSWRKAIPLDKFAIYRTIGSAVEQTKGGFQVSHHFCWKFGFIPWSCSKRSGNNNMRLDNTYRFSTRVASGSFTDSGQADNVEAIDIRMWSLFVTLKVKDGELKPGFPQNTAEAELTGACGAGTARDNANHSAGAMTASGDVTGVCD